MNLSHRHRFGVFLASVFLISCATTVKPYGLSLKHSAESVRFTDSDLAVHLRTNRNGMIYVYSPSMPLSVQGLGEARKIAANHQIAFLALLDPMTLNSSRADPALKGAPVLASRELISRNATQHFPATIFYREGALKGRFNPGYEAPEIFASKLKAFLESKSASDDFRSEIDFDQSSRLPADALTSPRVLGFLREIPLPTEPTYFIRVDSDANRMYMSGDCIVSLVSGECVNSNRTWEPYPIAGFDTLSIPGCDKTGGMCFYDMRSFRSQKEDVPVFVDPDLRGYYQSVGFLSRSASQAVIRLITYYGFMRDYVVKKGSVEAKGTVKKFCEDRPLLKLPMLSKDGRFLSGWDTAKKRTVIMSLSNDGVCSEVYSFSEMVSKMDWSYDGSIVAFHVSKSKTGIISEETPPDELLDQQIFIMDLNSKKVKKLSSGPDAHYFPHFGRNGLIYSLKRDSKSTKFSVLEIDPAAVQHN